MGLRNASPREVVGQVGRVVFGLLGALIGRVPTGNAGGADVPAERPMPIPQELRARLALVEPRR